MIDGPWKQRYQERFRQDVFHLLAQGYTLARPELASTMDEPDVTSRIADGIEDYLHVAPLRFDRYDVAPERPVRSELRHGKRRRRIDIAIRGRLGRRRSFHIEAKRLREGAASIADYVGADGLEMFVLGEYAPNEVEAGMLGYMQTGHATVWFTDIGEAIDRDARGTLRVVEGLTEIPSVGKLSPSGRTRHTRVPGSIITVYHIIIDCR